MARRFFAMPKGWWIIPACLLVIAVVYVFLASFGTFTHWPTRTVAYDLQAEGFRHGRLNMTATPSSELLVKSNPWDFAYRNLWFWDISLFKGKYYAYWGPLPAVVQALAKSILGIHGLIGDQYLIFGFCWLSSAFGAIVLDRIARLLEAPRYLLVLGIFAFAFVNPVPYLLTTGEVYEAALAAGQAGLIGGLAAAFYAVWHADSGTTPRAPLIVAGSAWALALASRASLAPSVALLIVTTVIACSYPRLREWKRLVRDALSVGVPVVLGCLVLMVFNKARFESWFETGLSKQLTTLPFKFAFRYIGINLYSYLLRPYESSCRFPFALAYWELAPHGIPGGMTIPDGYLLNEPVAGVLRVVPCAWLVPIPVAVVLSAAWHRVRSGGIARDDDDPLRNLVSRPYAWSVVSLAIAGSVSCLPELGLYMATMRYLADVSFALVLLGLIGAWTLRARLACSRWARAIANTLCAGLCAATIAFGLLLGYQGYFFSFQRNNPELNNKIINALSVCKTRT